MEVAENLVALKPEILNATEHFSESVGAHAWMRETSLDSGFLVVPCLDDLVEHRRVNPDAVSESLAASNNRDVANDAAIVATSLSVDSRLALVFSPREPRRLGSNFVFGFRWSRYCAHWSASSVSPDSFVSFVSLVESGTTGSLVELPACHSGFTP